MPGCPSSAPLCTQHLYMRVCFGRDPRASSLHVLWHYGQRKSLHFSSACFINTGRKRRKEKHVPNPLPAWCLQARLQLSGSQQLWVPGMPWPTFHVNSWNKIMNSFIIAEAQFAMTSYAYLYLSCTLLLHTSE